MFPKNEELNDIINRMENLSSNEKIYFEKIFESISKKQEELFINLKDDIKKELHNSKKEKIDIYTMLVEGDKKVDLKEYNVYEICDNCKPLENEIIYKKNIEINNFLDYYCGIVFWCDEYELMQDVINKGFVAKVRINEEEYDAKYILRNTDVFVLKEKNIQSMAMQYGIENPLIYNPMARRALEVIISFPRDVSKNDIIEIDFDFVNNEIDKYLLLNRYLMWNVECKKSEELPEPKIGEYREVLPLWDYTFQIYKFPLKTENKCFKEYILVENDLRIIKRVNNDIYWQLNDSYKEMRYEKYTTFLFDNIVENRLSSQIQYFYHNDYTESEIVSVDRVRTKADVMRIISGFNNLGIKCKDVYIKSNRSDENVIYTYPKRMDYYQIKDDRLCSSNICKIVFEVDEMDKMFIDKISYIISFLNHRYPEYRWIGVN